MFHVPEKYRVCHPFADGPDLGNDGAFLLPPVCGKRQLAVVASDGGGWDHVSVHAVLGKQPCTPLWQEMCAVKDLFWDAEDVVMQIHPKKSQYVNVHPYTLHLWKPQEQEIPLPPRAFV
jgi:hypothetical protein